MPTIQVASTFAHSQLPLSPQVEELIEGIALSLIDRLTTAENQRSSMDLPEREDNALPVSIYIKQQAYHLEMSESDIILMYILIERYLQKTNNPITTTNIHNLSAICAMLAYKYNSEDTDELAHKLRRYPLYSGLLREEINMLEIQLLTDLNYELLVSETSYLTTKQNLIDLAQSERLYQQRGEKSCFTPIQPPSTPPQNTVNRLPDTRGKYLTLGLFSSTLAVYNDTPIQRDEENCCCRCW